MNLSDTQLKLLNDVKEHNIPINNDYFNNNEQLRKLYDLKLIDLETEIETSNGQYGTTIKRIFLTADGENELELEQKSKQIDKKNNFWFPLSSSVISGIIGTIVGFALGWLAAYLKLK
ncbi:hypothetical protein [Lapidilactobacillus wuchangensis]|uniref:hypothetical protein n=1 Tax=Lapidilactobacillus wuchangensis TaxID=2486001 RepID=UPI000F78B9C1|nr:hypothetical protein [Lapidilactobacillus wuchangensis]